MNTLKIKPPDAKSALLQIKPPDARNLQSIHLSFFKKLVCGASFCIFISVKKNSQVFAFCNKVKLRAAFNIYVFPS